MAESEWHQDRRVIMGMIGALLIQSASAIWWASAINNRVEQVEGRVTQDRATHADKNKEQDVRLLNLENARQLIGERLSSIEANMAAVANGVQRIDSRLERLTDQKVKP